MVQVRTEKKSKNGKKKKKNSLTTRHNIPTKKSLGYHTFLSACMKNATIADRIHYYIDKKVVTGLNKIVSELKHFEIRMLQTFRLEAWSLPR